MARRLPVLNVSPHRRSIRVITSIEHARAPDGLASDLWPQSNVCFRSGEVEVEARRVDGPVFCWWNGGGNPYSSQRQTAVRAGGGRDPAELVAQAQLAC